MNLQNILFECVSFGSSTSCHTSPQHTRTHTLAKLCHSMNGTSVLTTEIFHCKKHSKHKVSVNQDAQEVGDSGYLKFPVKFWLKILIPFTLTQ